MVGKKCGLLPSYTVDSQGRCIKYIECTMSGRISSPKCKAKAEK